MSHEFTEICAISRFAVERSILGLTRDYNPGP